MTKAGAEDPGGRGAVLLASVQRGKRQAIVGACERCRSKKIKCDGQRPCSTCKKKSTQCIFEVEPNESHQEARKRKFEEISQAYGDAQDLLAAIASSDERTALEIFDGIRKGRTVATILQDCQKYSQQESAELDNQKRRKLFIMAFVQSTVSLKEVIRVGVSILEAGSNIHLPQLTTYESIRDTIIHLESIGKLLRDANPHVTSLRLGGTPEYSLSSLPHAVGDGIDHGPLVWVHTAPWVSLNVSNHATSHLISIFLRINNPFWRFVEEDLFVKAMRSGQLDSGYCSPFLVNAILALASQQSEIEEAFFTPGELLTRGEHFHQEALRLWALEEGHVSLTNIQALLILSIESGVRGNDKLGNQLIIKAYTLHKMLPIPHLEQGAGSAARHYCRARRVTAWTVVYLECQFAIALRRKTHAHPFEMPEIDNFLPESATLFWIGYPLRHDPLPLKINLLLRARNALTCILRDVCHFFFHNKQPHSAAELLAATRAMAQRLHDWERNLPEELQRASEVPIGVFDLHCQHTLLHIYIYSYADAFLPNMYEPVSEQALDEASATFRARALRWACHAADLSRQYRELYGLKIINCIAIPMLTSAAYTFLQNLKGKGSDGLARDDSDENQTALEEIIRGLLAGGLQAMLPRFLLRTVYRAAQAMGVGLPQDATRLIVAAAEASWSSSDLKRVQTMYPGPAMGPDERKADVSVEELLREWEELNMSDEGGGGHSRQE